MKVKEQLIEILSTQNMSDPTTILVVGGIFLCTAGIGYLGYSTFSFLSKYAEQKVVEDSWSSFRSHLRDSVKTESPDLDIIRDHKQWNDWEYLKARFDALKEPYKKGAASVGDGGVVSGPTAQPEAVVEPEVVAQVVNEKTIPQLSYFAKKGYIISEYIDFYKEHGDYIGENAVLKKKFSIVWKELCGTGNVTTEEAQKTLEELITDLVTYERGPQVLEALMMIFN